MSAKYKGIVENALFSKNFNWAVFPAEDLSKPIRNFLASGTSESFDEASDDIDAAIAELEKNDNGNH
jgi:hypothetical protein